MELTIEQQKTVTLLERKGFIINDARIYDGKSAPTVFMSRKIGRWSTRYAEIGPDATINGNANLLGEIACLLA